jgi:AAA domain
VGILNTIHLIEYNRFYERIMDTLLSDDSMKISHITGNVTNPSDVQRVLNPWINLLGKLSKCKPHMLVAAPSNIAVDNIIVKIFETGFYDGNASKYNPNILRVGVASATTGAHAKDSSSPSTQSSPTIKSISLEEIIDQETLAMTQPSERSVLMEFMNRSLLQIVEKLNMFLTFLRRLKSAFQNHGLPKGWEVRIGMDAGLPYWVDHVNCTSSLLPPPNVGLPKPRVERVIVRYTDSNTNAGAGVSNYTEYNRDIISNGDYTLTTLPEYQIYSHELTQLLDQFESIHLKLKRSQLRFNPADYSRQRASKQAIESSIIDSAHIIFTTLNSSGSVALEATNFCYTVIDEAAQVSPNINISVGIL